MQLNEIQALIDDLKESAPSSMSPYQATKIANRSLQIDLPPQMLYNYVKKGYITATIVEDRWIIKRNDFVEWLAKYALKNHLTLS